MHEIETWHINERINQYLLNSLSEENLSDTASSGGRNVGEQFAHIHNVRLLWLKAGAPGLLGEQVKIEKGIGFNKSLLSDSLSASGKAIAAMLEQGFKEGRIKGFKPHPSAFLGYLIAHESHHRGQIILSLKQSGHKVDQKVLYGLWEWGSR